MSDHTFRCRKFRHQVLDGRCIVTEHIVSYFSRNEEYACVDSCVSQSTVWYLDADLIPDWITDVISESQWTKGKISCPKCKGRLGSFDFITTGSCPCGQSVLPPVHIQQNRVDHHHMPCIQQSPHCVNPNRSIVDINKDFEMAVKNDQVIQNCDNQLCSVELPKMQQSTGYEFSGDPDQNPCSGHGQDYGVFGPSVYHGCSLNSKFSTSEASGLFAKTDQCDINNSAYISDTSNIQTIDSENISQTFSMARPVRDEYTECLDVCKFDNPKQTEFHHDVDLSACTSSSSEIVLCNTVAKNDNGVGSCDISELIFHDGYACSKTSPFNTSFDHICQNNNDLGLDVDVFNVSVSSTLHAGVTGENASYSNESDDRQASQNHRNPMKNNLDNIDPNLTTPNTYRDIVNRNDFNYDGFDAPVVFGVPSPARGDVINNDGDVKGHKVKKKKAKKRRKGKVHDVGGQKSSSDSENDISTFNRFSGLNGMGLHDKDDTNSNVGSSETKNERNSNIGNLKANNEDQQLFFPDEHTCAICYELFCNPMQCVPCGHIFCESCLRRLARSMSVNAQCPFCRAVIQRCCTEKELKATLLDLYPQEVKARLNMERKYLTSKFYPLPSTSRHRPFSNEFRNRRPIPGRRRGRNVRVINHERFDNGRYIYMYLFFLFMILLFIFATVSRYLKYILPICMLLLLQYLLNVYWFTSQNVDVRQQY